MDIAQFDYLNRVYAPLEQRAQELCRRLSAAGIPAEWGWYGNYSILAEGEWRTQHFPTPEVEVEEGSHKGGCDIGFRLDEIFVEFRLSREQALSFDFSQLPQPFDVYGVEDFLHDFYHAGLDLDGIIPRIAASGERAVNIGLTLPVETDAAALQTVAERCRRWIGL